MGGGEDDGKWIDPKCILEAETGFTDRLDMVGEEEIKDMMWVFNLSQNQWCHLPR